MSKVATKTPWGWVRGARRRAEMSQNQVARALEISSQAYQAWERPWKDGPTAAHFLHFCEIVGADPREAPYTLTIPG